MKSKIEWQDILFLGACNAAGTNFSVFKVHLRLRVHRIVHLTDEGATNPKPQGSVARAQATHADLLGSTATSCQTSVTAKETRPVVRYPKQHRAHILAILPCLDSSHTPGISAYSLTIFPPPSDFCSQPGLTLGLILVFY